MISSLLSVVSLLMSVAILLIGHGLQLTLLPLHANGLGWSTQWIGFLGSAYFLGFVAGCISVPILLSAVGHIRVFAVLCACAAISLLSMGIFTNVWLWLLGRFVIGWSISGLYMTIESWLNERADAQHRGSILSIYAIITMVSICVGQFIIGLPVKYPEILFMVATIFWVCSILPVGLVRNGAPKAVPRVSFHPKKLYDISHVAVVGAFLSGVITGGFWALAPVFAKNRGLALEQISYFMATAILGGALLQFPFGRLSDRMDRRRVVVMMALLGLLVCLSLPMVANYEPTWLPPMMLVFGGVSFPLYAILMAHANDNAKLGLVEISSGILMMNGAGSVVGPLIVAPLMKVTDYALFVVAGTAFAMLAVWTMSRILVHRVERQNFEPFADVPKTTQGVVELAPHEEQ